MLNSMSIHKTDITTIAHGLAAVRWAARSDETSFSPYCVIIAGLVHDAYGHQMWKVPAAFCQ